MSKPRVGDIVEYLSRNASTFQLEQADLVFEKGKRYTVSDIFADSWGIYLYFEGIPNKSFRSEMFGLIKSAAQQSTEGDKKVGKQKTGTAKGAQAS